MKKLTLIRLAAIFAALTLSGCAHSMHSYHVGDTDLGPTIRRTATHDKVIEAQGEQFVVLFMTGNTDFVEQAYSKLLAQCPQGEIVGVNSRHSTALGFLSYTNKLVLRGVCRS